MKTTNIISFTLAMVLAAAGAARADFVLTGIQHSEVTDVHGVGILWDNSTADVRENGNIYTAYVNNMARLRVLKYPSNVAYMYVYTYHTSGVEVFSGYVREVHSYDTSNVDISGGQVNHVYAYNTSSVDVFGGEVGNIYLNGDSMAHVSEGTIAGAILAYSRTSVDVSGGYVSGLWAYDTSCAELSGGDVFSLFALGTSTTTFHGYDFRATSGLTIDGDRVLGTGVLAGKWLDGTAWTVSVQSHDPGATILAIPEPATLWLLALGGLAMVRRRRK